jgi:hypothetical protein
MDRIVALYWDNIDPGVVEAQRKVFAHFGLRIDQRERTGVNHGDFLDAYMAEIGADDIALLMDIDCFPLNREIVDRAFASARQGGIFGCAQSSSHVDPHRIFVAPMFMAISRRTWNQLGRPSFSPDTHNDVAQRLHDVAVAAGVEVEMLYPWAAIVPKWRLGDIALYGIGTFYRGGVFHLFESRWTPFSYILFDVADAVVNDRPVDYSALMEKSLTMRGNQRWARRVTRWKKAIWWRRLRKGLGGGAP